jgi:flagellar biogenesis protein FliO
MKWSHLFLSALLISAVPAEQLPGQSPAGQVLSRGHLSVVSTSAPPVSAGAVGETRATQHAFPTFSPGGNLAEDVRGAATSEASTRQFAGPAITVAFSLVVVLGLFASLVCITRKFGSRGIHQGVLPKEVLQGLGSAAVDARTRITLIRCGTRILVIAQTATGVHPLAEITNPEEVRELSAACLGESKQAFASTLHSIEQETAQPGYLGGQTDAPAPRARGRLFATA